MGRRPLAGGHQVDLINQFLAWLSSLFAPAAGGAVTLSAASGVTEIEVRAAIQQGIIDPLGLPDNAEEALVAQWKNETASGTAWYFQGNQPDGKPPTYNLFNRHAGSGRGEWTHQSKYVGPGDTDIRIFEDVYQSARDYAQLLQDPLYRPALAALTRGDNGGYFHALDVAGFDAHGGGYTALAATFGYSASAGIFG